MTITYRAHLRTVQMCRMMSGVVSDKVQPLALIRRPSPRLAEGLVTHIARQSVDIDKAMRQWEAYVHALKTNGWKTIEVPEVPDCPDGVFVEDTLLVFKDFAVITLPGAVSRRPEVKGAEQSISALGYKIGRISGPGTLDGGDVLKVNSTIYVGIGGRTNQMGADQLQRFLKPLGGKVITVPTSLVLHLKSAVTALPDGTIIGYTPLVDNPKIFEKFLHVPEESGSHVVLLGGNKLLIADSCPKTHSMLRSMGYDLVVVDISEFEKLEGCVTCLSVRCRDPPSRP